MSGAGERPFAEMRESGTAGDPGNDRNKESKTLLRQTYGENALKIARYMLIAHSGSKPVKKRELTDALKETSGGLNRAKFQEELKSANYFLQDKLGMRIVELGPVRMQGTRFSPKRDEYMLVSLTHSQRLQLYRAVPEYELHEWGILCFALILIVLKGEGVGFNELCDELLRAQLIPNEHTSSDPDVNKEVLRRIMHKFLAQRVFETVKKRPTDEPEGSSRATANIEEPEDVFYIGPYAKFLISGNELYVLILKLHFFNEKYGSAEFDRAHAVAKRSLRTKIANAILGEVRDADS